MVAMLLVSAGPGPCALPRSTCYEKMFSADGYRSADDLGQDTYREASMERLDREIDVYGRNENGSDYNLDCGLREKQRERCHTLLPWSNTGSRP